MINDIHSAHHLSSSSGLGSVAPRSDLSVMRQNILQALTTDDWESFAALALDDSAEINIATERFENGQNCFHVAIQSGSHSIASNLAEIDSEWVRDLANAEDHSGHTPLVYAARGQADAPEWIDTLIQANASKGAEKALSIAARNSHVKVAERLIKDEEKLGISPTYVLEQIIKFNYGDEQGINAARLLMSLGVSATDALPPLVSHSYAKTSAQCLILIGAKASERLAELATYHVPNEIREYVTVGADALRALRRLATASNGVVDIKAMKLLAAEESRIRDKRGSEIYAAALLTLVRNNDLAGIRVFASALNEIDPYMLRRTIKHLLKQEDSNTIAALMESGLIDPEKSLEDLASTGNIAATKVLLGTRVKTPAVLQTLFEQAIDRDDESLYALQTLILAGADTSTLPDSAHERIGIDQRKAQIAQLSSREKNESLLTAATNDDAVDAALLISGGADRLAALRELAQAKNWDDIRTLLNADMNAFETLFECVQAGDINLAKTLLEATDVSTAALYHLIKQGRLDVARAFIPAVTDGGQALLRQAAQDDDEALGRTLIDLGVNGAPVLASLAHTEQREIASRLPAWGVDVQTAWVHLTELDGYHASPGKQDLFLMGARAELVLLRALELDNAAAAQELATPWIGSRAMLRVVDDPTMTHDTKQARLKSLLQLEANADETLAALAKAGRTDEINHLIKLGAPAVGLLMDLSKQNDTRTIATLITAGADFGQAFQTLQSSNEQEALRVMTVSLALAQSNSTLRHARANNLAHRINPSGSVELL